MAKNAQKKNAQKKNVPVTPARKTPPIEEPWLETASEKEAGEEIILGLLDLIVALDADVDMVTRLLGVDLKKNTRLQAYREWPDNHKTQWCIGLHTEWGGQWGAEVQLSSNIRSRKQACFRRTER